MLPMGPGQIVPGLIAKVGVLPGIVTFRPSGAVRRAQVDLRKAGAVIEGEREKGCGRPAARLRKGAADAGDGTEVDGVAAEKEGGFVEQRGRIRLRQFE